MFPDENSYKIYVKLLKVLGKQFRISASIWEIDLSGISQQFCNI